MRYVAFLRAINVGGNKTIRMESLRNMFESRGYSGVKTYVNSGNVIFESVEKDTEQLAAKIENAIKETFSMTVEVMVRSIDELREIIENNPFEGMFDDPRHMHVLFVNESLAADKSDLLTAQNNESEMFCVRGREIYCLLLNGVAKSLLGKDFISKKLKVSATGRNWRTVNKVLEL